ncbi:winged helix-turn-helix domain-containing protein [Chloroflexus sp.]|uniref:winged helix-turn-helix domain-containing protein n=1 Tax=Chloroflexus sp. TaxID=1904827 RepID=UPI002ACDB866|nr:winged helix-turn-helix domain-containing protein [Chloroflexus sp.]
MSRGIALLLDYDNASRTTLVNRLHEWQWPVLATADARLMAHYLNDQRITICIANAALFTDLPSDLKIFTNKLSLHQKIVLAGGDPWLLMTLNAIWLACMIWLPYPVPHALLEAIVQPKPVSDDRGALAADHIEADSPCLFAIDPIQRRLYLGQREVRLSKDELTLLQYLYDANGRLCRYEELARLLYPSHYDEEEARHLLRGRMYYLQSKIERDPKNPEYLVCERGIGYQLRLPRQQSVANPQPQLLA